MCNNGHNSLAHFRLKQTMPCLLRCWEERQEIEGDKKMQHGLGIGALIDVQGFT
jgi:hypothetical protein